MARKSKIAVAADHAGFPLKEKVRRYLADKGYEVTDYGTNSPDSVDYPDYAEKVATQVAAKDADFGVLICGTGIGSQIAANRIPGVRACVCHECYSARISRAHNDANLLCLGARVIGVELAKELVRIWLAEPFSGEERHARRLAKIAALDRERGV